MATLGGASRPSRLRRGVLLLLKLGGATIATLLLLEVVLRVVGFRPASVDPRPRDPKLLHPEPFIADAQRAGWIPWPYEKRRVEGIAEHPRGFVEVRRNNVSCRADADTLVHKPANTVRVMMIGDSHTDGVCFNNESIARELESGLNQLTEGRPVEVINAGFGPSSPYQQWWAYEQVYRKFQPDHVVMVFYAGNDLIELLRRDDRVHLEWDGTKFIHAAARGGGDSTQNQLTLVQRGRGWLRDHSATYHALTGVRVLRRLVRRAAADAYRDRLDAAQERYAGPVWQGLNQAYYFEHHPEDWDSTLEMEREVLTLVRDACRQDQIEFTLAVLPTLRAIHPETDQAALADAQRILQLDDRAIQRDEQACAAVIEMARSLNIHVVDLRPALRQAREKAPRESLYYRFDHHLNLAGNRVVATALAEEWRSRREASGPEKPRAAGN